MCRGKFCLFLPLFLAACTVGIVSQENSLHLQQLSQ
jgi:hypothetical protein